MSSIVLTRRGRLVRTVVLLALLVAAVVALFALVHILPGATLGSFTDAQWRDAVADHAAQIAR